MEQQVKKKKGGWRPGAGRKPGSRNKSTTAIYKAPHNEAWKIKPIDHMMHVLNDPNTPAERKDEMAKACAPYFHPRVGNLDPNAMSKPVKYSIDLSKLTKDELLFLKSIQAKAQTPLIEAQAEEVEEGQEDGTSS